MISRNVLLIAILALVQNCSSGDRQFQAILNSPDEFHQTYVEITGILHIRPEDFAIYVSHNAEPNAAIWINPAAGFLSDHKGIMLDGKKVKLTGTFNRNDKGHLGQYAGAIHNTQIIDIDPK